MIEWNQLHHLTQNQLHILISYYEKYPKSGEDPLIIHCAKNEVYNEIFLNMECLQVVTSRLQKTFYLHGNHWKQTTISKNL